MVWIVVALNFSLGLICWRVAWQFWKLRRVIGGAAKNIEAADRNTYKTLHPAPEAIQKGQKAIQQLRKQPQQLDLQRQRLQQLLGILRLLQWAWFRGGLSRWKILPSNRKV